MAERPELEGAADPIVSEAVTALAAALLPEEVRGDLDGKGTTSIVTQGELPALLSKGFEQAGIGRTEVAMQILQIKIDHLREDLERLERAQEKGMTDSRVVALVLGVMTPLLAAAYLLGRAIQ